MCFIIERLDYQDVDGRSVDTKNGSDNSTYVWDIFSQFSAITEAVGE